MGRVLNQIILNKKDLELIPKRKEHANKGTYKRVLIVAGSFGMAGAAFLAAYSAYRMGAGLVYILSIEENREILQRLIPEAIVYSFERSEVNADSAEWSERLDNIIRGKDIVVLGPGLGTDEYSKILVGQVLERIRVKESDSVGVPAVIDADALNIISGNEALSSYLGSNMIVTPHPGEMSRLTGLTIKEIESDREKAAEELAKKLGVTVLLKGHETVIVTSDGKEYLNKSGSPALAKAGSGDVLSGIIAGLMCLGFAPQMAAPMGAFIHGLAGEAAAEELGEHSVLARDVADAIGKVLAY